MGPFSLSPLCPQAQKSTKLRRVQNVAALHPKSSRRIEECPKTTKRKALRELLIIRWCLLGIAGMMDVIGLVLLFAILNQ
ncbi:MAG TPA: hypothetical protein VFA26_18955 [Gemmataceae bacterium]|nr:hypothetical protein [Gemmataceae bacterium]